MELNPAKYPLVSIALCTYNGEAYLSQQLETIIQQTYLNLEIVILDDGSTDNTVQLIKTFQQKDPRIKFFQNEINLGCNKAFEIAFSLCNGEYIAIADQDDIWEIEKIAILLKDWPERSSFIFSLSGSFTNNEFLDRKAAPDIYYTDVDDVLKLVFNSPVHGHACIFKKEFLQVCTPFPVDIYYDWWMSMHAAANGSIGCIPYTLTWHREHANNYSRTITSLKDKDERNKQLRLQCAYFIETFCARNILHHAQKAVLLKYASLLKKMDGKGFSWQMFKFIFKERKRVFHYKKDKPFIMLSYIKHAIRMGYKGLL